MQILRFGLKVLLGVAPLFWIGTLLLQPLQFIGAQSIPVSVQSVKLSREPGGYGGRGGSNWIANVLFTYQVASGPQVGNCFSSGGNVSNMIVGFDEKVSTARAAVGQTMVAFKSRWNANVCLYHAWPWKILAVALFVFFAFACLAHSPASPLNRAAGNGPRMTKRLT